MESPSLVHPVADFADACGECPFWDPATQSLYWTDCVGLKFSRYDAATGAATILRSGIEIYGFRPNAFGGWIVTNPSGACFWDGGAADLASFCTELDGEPLPLNDCSADAHGRLITGTFHYAPGTDYKLGKLILIDTDGTPRILDDGFHLINGIGFSPDDRTLYATDTVLRRIYAYDYDTASGTASNKRILVELPSTEGIPDGLAVDEAGRIWSASWFGSAVNCFTPDGVLAARIAMPVKQPSSVAFGGPELKHLYITTAANSDALPVMPEGYDHTVGPFGGALFRIELGTRGLPQRPAAIRRGELKS